MKYVEVTFHMDETGVMRDMLVDALGNEGPYESFVETSDGLKAYVRASEYDAHYLAVVAESFPLPLRYEVAEMEDKDWNAEWEREHEAVLVKYNGGAVWVRAPFHPHRSDVDYELVIEPKMSFGTAHHPTTYMMLSYVAELPVAGRRVLDMGCGTAVLAILAGKRGAAYVEGVDIDDWAFNNARENAQVNGVRLELRLGGAEQLQGSFDIVLANINRNILLADMERYVAVLAEGGRLVMSGFYEADVEAIVRRGEALGLRLASRKEREGWAAVELVRRKS
ncbi:MAG: 50S ribosomal protein L11 methyltransferase [Bacteroidales bacterium]|nr:50S ribosomal protein L11 methyltransferase [Bacteroidales bacterium]